MVVLYIFMFFVFSLEDYFNKKNKSIILLFYINFFIAISFFYIHVTDNLNLSF